MCEIAKSRDTPTGGWINVWFRKLVLCVVADRKVRRANSLFFISRPDARFMWDINLKWENQSILFTSQVLQDAKKVVMKSLCLGLVSSRNFLYTSIKGTDFPEWLVLVYNDKVPEEEVEEEKQVVDFYSRFSVPSRFLKGFIDSYVIITKGNPQQFRDNRTTNINT